MEFKTRGCNGIVFLLHIVVSVAVAVSVPDFKIIAEHGGSACSILFPNIRSPAFIDNLYTHVLNRLQRFVSPDLCGKWNETLFVDFCKDRGFYRDAEGMIESSVAEHFRHRGPCLDGLNVHSVEMVSGHSICVRFQFFFLIGNAVCPASYRLTRVGTRIHRVEFGCGHPDESGRLKYDYKDKHHGRYDEFPLRPEHWAIYVTRDYDTEVGMGTCPMPSTDSSPLSKHIKRHLDDR